MQIKNRIIILASASPRRKKLLKQIISKFKVIEPSINEAGINPRRLTPINYARALARRKAENVARRLKVKNALVIGADTIVYAHGKIIGKPHSKKNAQLILKQLSGTTHSVITGLCLIDTHTNRSISGHDQTRIRMKKLSAARLQTIIAAPKHLDKAGGYAIQETGDKNIRIIKGSLSNAVGLPLKLLQRLTKKILSQTQVN